MVLAVLALVLAAAQVPDTATYADDQTARLIAQARLRHRVQDTLVHDYQALVRTRVDAGFGRSRFARILPIAAVETAAQITWAEPNELKVKIAGVRSASAISGAKVEGSFSDPWFVARGLGDSIRFVDQELPETPAIHPLAPQGDDYYRFAIFDSISIDLPGRRLSAIGVRITPKRLGNSLIAGNMWLDVETAEVVRLTFRYVGDYLWSTPDSGTSADSAKARKENARANRILSIDAELEYALHESRYWMPYRQIVTLMVDIPWFISAKVPVRFITRFSDYRINQGSKPHFTIAPSDSGRSARCRRSTTDSLCNRARDRERKAAEGFTRAEWAAGGRWEVEVPPRDSIADYPWPDVLALQPDAATEQLIRETAATLAKVEQTLPAEWVGRAAFGVAYDRFADLFRYNRVQGISLGAGAEFRTGTFTSLLGTARLGLSDRRPTGSLIFRRDAAGGRLDVSAWRAVREVEPWTRGASLGNSLNAVLAGHDGADYYLALGGGVSFFGNSGAAQDAEFDIRFEQARSMATRAHSVLNDWLGGTGRFQPNPDVLPGDYVAAAVSRRSVWGLLETHYGVEGMAGVGGQASGRSAGRMWTSARLGSQGRGATLRLKAGTMLGDSLPQLSFRVGGTETVRGYSYGTVTGRHLWSAQLDLVLRKRSLITPVLFADAGNTQFSGKPLSSIGGGLSLLGGLLRLDIAKGLTPRTSARFDLVFRTAP